MIRWLNRRFNQAWAFVGGYFWLPCPRCGEMFGGHEKTGSHLYYIPKYDGSFRMVCKKHQAPEGTKWINTNYETGTVQAMSGKGEVLETVYNDKQKEEANNG